MNKKSIYVSVPSLPDKELYFTIHQCLAMAKNPKNIYIGIAYYNDLDSELDPYELIKSFNNPNIKIKVYDINDEKNSCSTIFCIDVNPSELFFLILR